MNNVNEITSIKASAVPAVPKQLSASQRIAALELAQKIEDHTQAFLESKYGMKLLDDARRLLRELAGDAKGER
jgi:hypothetical protein